MRTDDWETSPTAEPLFQDTVVAVTGASRGWGRATAVLFAQHRAKVVVNGRDELSVADVVAEIEGSGGCARAVVGTVVDDDLPERLVDVALAEFGSIDVLVNNAGQMKSAPLLDMSDADWDTVLDIQLRAPFRCARAAARAMRDQRRGGHVINIAGAAGIRGMAGAANHAASKAGLLAATWSWALELAPLGIRVNAARAAVDTDAARKLLVHTPGNPTLSARDRGYLSPRSAAELVVWLASPMAEGINGQFLGLDSEAITLWGRAEPLARIEVDPETLLNAADRLGARLIAASSMSQGVGEITPALANLDIDHGRQP